MHYTIELLMKGDLHIVDYYARAKEMWAGILASPEASDVDALASRLSSEQLLFESECGGRWIGQEIMVVVGITQFYSTEIGFEGSEETALRVYNAFRASYCSLEVKGHADAVAESYDLVERAER